MNARAYGTIVVGAGSAGAAAAGRLAERGEDVLLIEAGADWRSEDARRDMRYPRSDVFAWKAGAHRASVDMTWAGLVATRMPGSEPAPYRRGRGVGGTSAINGLVAIRPPLEEFDDWVTDFGCVGWSAEEVLPYFVRLEDDTDFWPEPYHGRGGPLPIVRLPAGHFGKTDELLAASAAAAGHPWDPDLHRPHFFGASITAMNVRYGARITTNDGYLEPVRALGNFAVLPHATVQRVLLDGTRAIGVVALTASGAVEIRAERVVVCAGSASSPAILQRSGIGPAALLTGLGIPVRADLPVGVGMQDHAGYWLAVEFDAPAPEGVSSRGNVTLRWSSGLPGSGAGDLLMISANPLVEEPTVGALGVKLAQCFSRGSLAVTGMDPEASPDIRLGLLTDERDRALGRRSIRDAVAMLTGASDGPRVVALRDRTGREVSAELDDDELDGWLRSIAYDTSHLSGGCRIGAADDPAAVVGSDLAVHGIENLWVADLSVVPTVPRANTHLTAVMIGERLADVIAADHSRKER